MISDIQIKSFVNNIFTKYDVDQSDYLFEDEIKFVIEDAFEIMGARKLANQNDVKKFMGVVDKDNDGKVTRDELFNMIKKITLAF